MASIIEKLHKLIAHEQSAREIGNVAEAEAFAGKIQTLLTEHKLTMSEVEFQAQDTFDPMGQTITEGAGRTTPTWQSYLLQGVAQNFYCKVLTFGGSSRATFIGRNSDRTAAVEMFRYLVGLGEDIAKRATETYRSSSEVIEFAQTWGRIYGQAGAKREIVGKINAYKKSFLIGYGSALYSRLKVTRENLTVAASPQANGLILRDAAALQAYSRSLYPNVRTQSRSVSLGNSSGYAAGRAAGSNAALRSRPALGC